MAEDPFYSPNAKSPPPRVAQPGELLFEFVRASDGAQMSCELRFNGESSGWEAQFFERGELFYSRGGFVLRELAVRWRGAGADSDGGRFRREVQRLARPCRCVSLPALSEPLVDLRTTSRPTAAA
jgi:hypothetical protein